MHHATTFPFLAVVLVPLAAQQTIVSPVLAANVEGNNENLFPWANAGVPRYMQLHGDLGLTPLQIKKLAFRMDARDTVNYTAVNQIDLEMWMGHGVRATQPSWFFAQNYVRPRTTTIARKVINFGPQGQNSTMGPRPFTSNMNLVLDQPFQYLGSSAGSLVWEVMIHANTVGGTWARHDVDASSRTNTTSALTGAGCVASGQTAAMTHAVAMADMGGTVLMNITVTAGPANAPTYAALGTANPDVQVPGLCSNLQTNLTLTYPIGTTDGLGAISFHNAGRSAFALPNQFQNGTLFTQAHSLDPARADAIKVCNSNGRSTVVPTSDTSHVVDATRLFSQLGGTQATESVFFFGSIVGYALVTEFTY
jgi:hypothetical protein